MTLEQIFKTNLQLLETPEVRTLIDYVQLKHTKSYKLFRKSKDLQDKIVELIIYSEGFLIDGRSYKETVEAINELINN